MPNALSDYQDVFSNDNANKLPLSKPGDHAIDLNGNDSPYGPLYNLSAIELAALRTYLDDVLAKSWIRYFTSSAGAPILFILKKDRGLRLCVDYRGLNKVIIKNRHLLPLISETLDRMSGAQVFTKLDFKNAYHRIRVKRGDE